MDGRAFEDGGRLARLAVAQASHGKRLAVLFDGYAGSGRKAALSRLIRHFDPCHVHAHDGLADAVGEDRHWMTPYWIALPRSGHGSFFYRSWYRRLVGRRLAGLDEKGWLRGIDEINEFEAQQRDAGLILVKLGFAIASEGQQAALAEAQADPWRRMMIDHGLQDEVHDRGEHEALWNELFAATDTRWAPWTMIDANGADAEPRIDALVQGRVADALAAALPSAISGGDNVVRFGGR